MGEKTIECLMEAFAGESQANRKYLLYAKQAEKEGKLNAARLFRAAAEAETIHAHREFELAGKVGSTADNLRDAIGGETYERDTMYPDFADVAESEQEARVSRLFRQIAQVEGVHAKLYEEALEALESDTGELVFYVCPICGYVEAGRPDRCPICNARGETFLEVA